MAPADKMISFLAWTIHILPFLLNLTPSAAPVYASTRILVTWACMDGDVEVLPVPDWTEEGFGGGAAGSVTDGALRDHESGLKRQVRLGLSYVRLG